MERRLEDRIGTAWTAARRRLRRVARRRVLAILAALLVGSGAVYGVTAAVGNVDDLEKANKALQQALETIDPAFLAGTWFAEYDRCRLNGITRLGECAPWAWRSPVSVSVSRWLIPPIEPRIEPRDRRTWEKLDVENPLCRPYRLRRESCPHPLRTAPPELEPFLFSHPFLCRPPLSSALGLVAGQPCPYKILVRDGDQLVPVDPPPSDAPAPGLGPLIEGLRPAPGLGSDRWRLPPRLGTGGPRSQPGLGIDSGRPRPGLVTEGLWRETRDWSRLQEEFERALAVVIRWPPPDRDSWWSAWHSLKSLYFAARTTFRVVWAEETLTRAVLFGTLALTALMLGAMGISAGRNEPSAPLAILWWSPLLLPLLAALLALALKYLLILLTVVFGAGLAFVMWAGSVLTTVGWFLGKVADAYRYDRWMTRYERWQRRRGVSRPAPVSEAERNAEEGPARPAGPPV